MCQFGFWKTPHWPQGYLFTPLTVLTGISKVLLDNFSLLNTKISAESESYISLLPIWFAICQIFVGLALDYLRNSYKPTQRDSWTGYHGTILSSISTTIVFAIQSKWVLTSMADQTIPNPIAQVSYFLAQLVLGCSFGATTGLTFDYIRHGFLQKQRAEEFLLAANPSEHSPPTASYTAMVAP